MANIIHYVWYSRGEHALKYPVELTIRKLFFMYLIEFEITYVTHGYSEEMSTLKLNSLLFAWNDRGAKWR
jgi:hypothetical protein